MKESEVKQHFDKHRNALFKKLNRKDPLSDTICTEFGKAYLGNKYRGTYSQNSLALTRGYYIFNTDHSDNSGIHWVACVNTGRTMYIYDSFARSRKQLLKTLTKRLKFNKADLKIVEADRNDAEQKGDSAVCGHLCLAFLFTAHDLGIRNAIKI